MFIRRVNIFLLSLCMIVAPTLTFAIDAPIPPFTSASAAGDIAASLGKRPTGGFPASAAGGLAALAAIGVGVGSYCLASEALGAFGNSCSSPNNPICNSLGSIGITNCKPNADGSFAKNPTGDQPDQDYYYISTVNGTTYKGDSRLGVCNVVAKALYGSTYSCGAIGATCGSATSLQVQILKPSGAEQLKICTGRYARNAQNPAPPIAPPQIATPEEVGAAVAGNPAAANSMGAAANAAADSGCDGAYGTFNGVTKCWPSFNQSNNISCKGLSGVVGGMSVCLNPDDNSNPACSAGFGTFNGVVKCLKPEPHSAACSGVSASIGGLPVCLNSNVKTDYSAVNAVNAANEAAAAAASNPPAARSCSAPLILDSATKVCVNPTSPQSPAETCKPYYVYHNGNCVAADPLNPTLPAVRTPATAQQATANAAAAAANTSLTNAQTTFNAAAAAAAAAPTDQSKADAKVAAAAALNQAQATANTANLGAIAAKPDTMDLPAFCGWAAVVCDFVGWAKTEPVQPASTTVNVTARGVTGTALDNYDISQQRVNFSEQCPVPINFSFDFMGHTQPLAFSFEPFCEFLTKIKPIIIACAYVGGAYIVSGATRKSDS